MCSPFDLDLIDLDKFLTRVDAATYEIRKGLPLLEAEWIEEIELTEEDFA